MGVAAREKLPRVTLKIKCWQALWFWGTEVNPPICLAALQEFTTSDVKLETLFHLAVSKNVRRKCCTVVLCNETRCCDKTIWSVSLKVERKTVAENNEIIRFTRCSSRLPVNLLTIPLNFRHSKTLPTPVKVQSSKFKTSEEEFNGKVSPAFDGCLQRRKSVD